MGALPDSLLGPEREGWSSGSRSDPRDSTILQPHARVSEHSGYPGPSPQPRCPAPPPPTVDENADRAFRLGPLRVTTANSVASPPPTAAHV